MDNTSSLCPASPANTATQACVATFHKRTLSSLLADKSKPGATGCHFKSLIIAPWPNNTRETHFRCVLITLTTPRTPPVARSGSPEGKSTVHATAYSSSSFCTTELFATRTNANNYTHIFIFINLQGLKSTSFCQLVHSRLRHGKSASENSKQFFSLSPYSRQPMRPYCRNLDHQNRKLLHTVVFHDPLKHCSHIEIAWGLCPFCAPLQQNPQATRPAGCLSSRKTPRDVCMIRRH